MPGKFTASDDVAKMPANPAYAGNGIISDELWIKVALRAAREKDDEFFTDLEANLAQYFDLPSEKASALRMGVQRKFGAAGNDHDRAKVFEQLLADLRA